MTYHDLLPIDRRIAYRGLLYTIKALCNNGAVCRTDNGTHAILMGTKTIKEVGRAVI